MIRSDASSAMLTTAAVSDSSRALRAGRHAWKVSRRAEGSVAGGRGAKIAHMSGVTAPYAFGEPDCCSALVLGGVSVAAAEQADQFDARYEDSVGVRVVEPGLGRK